MSLPGLDAEAFAAYEQSWVDIAATAYETNFRQVGKGELELQWRGAPQRSEVRVRKDNATRRPTECGGSWYRRETSRKATGLVAPAAAPQSVCLSRWC
ncbi:hypothetical protein MRX96_051396 [Rhipicephalus microplus]